MSAVSTQAPGCWSNKKVEPQGQELLSSLRLRKTPAFGAESWDLSLMLITPVGYPPQLPLALETHYSRFLPLRNLPSYPWDSLVPRFPLGLFRPPVKVVIGRYPYMRHSLR